MNQSQGEQRPEDLHLLIVDDHGMGREGMLALFRRVENVRAEATEPREAAWAVRRFAPEVVLIDLGFSDGQSFDTAESILKQGDSTRVMFLDNTLRPVHLSMAIAAGAHGYWTKRASFDQLCEAVRRVAAGQFSVCPAGGRYLVHTDGRMQFDLTASGTPLAGLTRRERQVLVLLAKGLSLNGTAERLELSPRTIDSHRSSLMKKLDIHKVTDLVRLALREGLIRE